MSDLVRGLRSWILYTIKCWNVLRFIKSIDFKLFHFSQPYKTVGKTTDWYNLTSAHVFVELNIIPLMTKKAFRPILQALVVRSVALKREFSSIPRWQQLSDDGILSSPMCQLYIRFSSRKFSENCNIYDFFLHQSGNTKITWIFTANIEHTL